MVTFNHHHYLQPRHRGSQKGATKILQKNEWQNRNLIKTAEGKQWLTVPVSFFFPARIMEVGVNQSDNWLRKHWQALRTNYSKAPYWDSACEFLQAFYARGWDMLAPLNQASIAWLRGVLGVDTELFLASEVELSKEPTERSIFARPWGPIPICLVWMDENT